MCHPVFLLCFKLKYFQVRLQDGRTFTGIVEDVDVKSDLASIYRPPIVTLTTEICTKSGEIKIALITY